MKCSLRYTLLKSLAATWAASRHSRDAEVNNTSRQQYSSLLLRCIKLKKLKKGNQLANKKLLFSYNFFLLTNPRSIPETSDNFSYSTKTIALQFINTVSKCTTKKITQQKLQPASEGMDFADHMMILTIM